MPIKYISTKKAAELLDIQPRQVRKLVQNGTLTTDPEWTGREKHISLKSVEAYEKTERKTGPKPGKRKRKH